MPFAIGTAGAGVFGSLVGGKEQADATKQAANAELQASTNAANLQRDEFNTVQANEAPFIKAGTDTLQTLQQKLPSLTAGFDPTSAGVPSNFSYNPTDVLFDPAYQFTVAQGQAALDRSAASKGELLGDAEQKALIQFGQGAATQYENQDYNQAKQTYDDNYSHAFDTFTQNQTNAFNKLAGVTQLGTTGTAQVNSAGTNFANSASQIAESAGNASAAGIIGRANAGASAAGGISSSITALLNNPSFQSMLQKSSGGGSSYGNATSDNFS